MAEKILLGIVAFLASGAIGLLCYFLKGVSANLASGVIEMQLLNQKLVKVVTNQEWHFKAIIELQDKEKEADKRIFELEKIKFNSLKHEVIE